MLTITANAERQLKEILSGENSKYIRTFIEGGGCSGFNYGFILEDTKNEDDFEVNEYLIIDAMSMSYLNGSTIDFKKEIAGANFVIDNPNAKTTCGCGNSFSI